MMNFEELFEIIRADFFEKIVVDDLSIYRELFETDEDFNEFWKRVGTMADNGVVDLFTMDIYFRNNKPVEK